MEDEETHAKQEHHKKRKAKKACADDAKADDKPTILYFVLWKFKEGKEVVLGHKWNCTGHAT